MRTFALFSALAVVACAVPAVRQTCTPAGDKCAGAPNFPLVPYTGCCDRNLVCGPRLQPAAGTWGAFCITAAEASAPTPAPPSSSTAPAATVAATGAAATTAAVGATTAAVGATTGVSAATGPTTVAAATRTSPPTMAAAMTTTDVAPMATSTPAPAESVNATSVVPTTMMPNATEANATTPLPTVEPTVLPNTTALPNRTLASPTPEGNGSKCFPSTATVELENGAVLKMDKLSVGDMVKVGPNSFSKVFMFTHKLQTGDYSFVQLTTASGASLSLTSGHYIPVDGVLVAASEVVVGDIVQLGSGATDSVVTVKTVLGTGLFNPQTIHGDIVVDGVIASTYTTAVQPRLAHAVLSPFRLMSAVLGVDFAFLESGGGLLADVSPRGQLIY